MAIKRGIPKPRLPNGTKVKFVTKSLRMTPQQAKRINRAATKKLRTFNYWCVAILMDAADDVLTKEKGIIPDGATTSEQTSQQ